MWKLIDMRCPRCDRYLCSVEEGSRYRTRCRDCGLVIEEVARGALTAAG